MHKKIFFSPIFFDENCCFYWELMKKGIRKEKSKKEEPIVMIWSPLWEILIIGGLYRMLI